MQSPDPWPGQGAGWGPERTRACWKWARIHMAAPGGPVGHFPALGTRGREFLDQVRSGGTADGEPQHPKQVYDPQCHSSSEGQERIKRQTHQSWGAPKLPLGGSPTRQGHQEKAPESCLGSQARSPRACTPGLAWAPPVPSALLRCGPSNTHGPCSPEQGLPAGAWGAACIHPSLMTSSLPGELLGCLISTPCS